MEELLNAVIGFFVNLKMVVGLLIGWLGTANSTTVINAGRKVFLNIKERLD